MHSSIPVSSSDFILWAPPSGTTVFLPWDCDRFSERAKDTIDDDEHTVAGNLSLFDHVEKVELGLMSSPCVLVDRHDRILLWYLPGILSHRIVSEFSWALGLTYIH